MQGPDEQIMGWIDDHRVAWVTAVTEWLMNANGNPWLLALMAAPFAVVVVRRRAWRVSICTLCAALTAGRMSDLLKQWFERPRPQFPDALVQVDGWAMPSSHASVMAAACVTLVCTIAWTSAPARAWVSAFLALGALLIALAMIYLGAHWPTDVLAGWAFGGAVGAGFGFVFRPREH